MNELESLQNAATNLGLKVHEKWTHDKRRKVKRFYLTLNGSSISPVLDYSNLNHFILGFWKASNL
jgi:hypothetical protein